MASCLDDWHCAIDLIYIDADHIELERVEEKTGFRFQLIVLVVCHLWEWEIAHSISTQFVQCFPFCFSYAHQRPDA